VSAPETNLDALAGREIVVGVTGGIAAYKTAMVVSRLVQAGSGVSVVMTASAAKFVTPLTFQTLTGRPVHTDLFASPGEYHGDHIALAERAELVVVAPATANCLAKLAHGVADDLLSTTLLAIDAPLLFAPAMNSRMWQHPAVQANVKTLRERGVRFIGPEEGRLACGTTGPGRMAEPEDILAEIVDVVQKLGPRAQP
jgi:phosphopantothenoylcysteine decarboxylase/phosphopantothenate--cysteine ligase